MPGLRCAFAWASNRHRTREVRSPWPEGSGGLGQELLAAPGEDRRADRAVERERLLELHLALGSAAVLARATRRGCRTAKRENPWNNVPPATYAPGDVVTCRSCGSEVSERSNFCPECGSSIGERVRRPVAQERKTVTVLFCDLVGFTARSESADPEDVRTAMAPYQALLRR